MQYDVFIKYDKERNFYKNLKRDTTHFYAYNRANYDILYT